MTKLTKLLAYHYAQTTEPEEAARRAFSEIFGKLLNSPRMRLWVPEKHNVETVKAVANGLMRQVLGPREVEDKDVHRLGSTPVTAGISTCPHTARGFSNNILNVAERSQARRNRTPKLDPGVFVPPEQSAVPLSIPATDEVVPLYDSDRKPVMSVDRDGKPIQVLAPERA